jgi:hypothetical protein
LLSHRLGLSIGTGLSGKARMAQPMTDETIVQGAP